MIKSNVFRSKGGIIIKNFDGKSFIYKRSSIVERIHVFRIMPVLLFIVMCSISIIAANKMPDPVPNKIRQFLEQEGYDVNDIGFKQVSVKVDLNSDVYRSDKSIYYHGFETDLWKIYRWATLTKVHYIIIPYYM